MFFPLRDDNPTLSASFVTVAVIAANVACWIFLQGFGFDQARLAVSVCELGAIPGELFGNVAPGTEIDMGGGPVCVVGAARWSTVITAMFMHAGWLHLIGNMWFLWVFGDNVEDAMGHARFGAFYLLCGIAAFAAQAASDPASTAPMVGASGAIGGVLGAYARLYPRARVHMVAVWLIFVQRMVVPAVIVLGLWFLLQIISGLPTLGATGTGGVAFWAHAGGFLTGFVAIGLFSSRERTALHRARHQREVHSRDDGPFGL